jgi:Tfp pilus assembly protein PilF
MSSFQAQCAAHFPPANSSKDVAKRRFVFEAILCALLAAVVSSMAGCAMHQSAVPEDARTSAMAIVRAAMQAKDPAVEKKAYQDALALDGYNAVARNNLGVCYFKEGKYYNAAQEFDLAMKIAPSSPEPHFNLGLLYETVGKLDQGADQYTRALELDTESAKYRVCLARVYIKKGADKWRAQQLLEEALARELDPATIAWIRDAQEQLGPQHENGQPFE